MQAAAEPEAAARAAAAAGAAALGDDDAAGNAGGDGGSGGGDGPPAWLAAVIAVAAAVIVLCALSSSLSHPSLSLPLSLSLSLPLSLSPSLSFSLSLSPSLSVFHRFLLPSFSFPTVVFSRTPVACSHLDLPPLSPASFALSRRSRHPLERPTTLPVCSRRRRRLHHRAPPRRAAADTKARQLPRRAGSHSARIHQAPRLWRCERLWALPTGAWLLHRSFLECDHQNPMQTSSGALRAALGATYRCVALTTNGNDHQIPVQNFVRGLRALPAGAYRSTGHVWQTTPEHCPCMAPEKIELSGLSLRGMLRRC